MTLTSNMTITPDPANPKKRFFLDIACAGQTILDLYITYIKGNEEKIDFYSAVQKAGVWYSLGQRSTFFDLRINSTYYSFMEPPKTADKLRVIVEVFSNPDITDPSGTLDVKGFLA